MLTNVEPHLEDVAYGNTVSSNNAAKNAFPISGNAYVDIRFWFVCVPRKPEVFQDFRVQSLQIERRLHPVYEPNAQFFRGLEQSETQSGPSHPPLLARTWLGQPV
jgi:hypothetical protein